MTDTGQRVFVAPLFASDKPKRIRALWELPWVLPATVVIGMTDEDLDLLYAARDKDEYWLLLSNIVERLEWEAA